MFDFPDGKGFTVSIWFKVNKFNLSWQALIAKGENAHWRIHRWGKTNILSTTSGWVSQGVDSKSHDELVSPSKYDINDGKIHHFVLINDTLQKKKYHYIDGKQSATGEINELGNNSLPLLIGNNPGVAQNTPQILDRMWDGLIEDVAIWNRPISAEEVSTLYNSGKSLGVLIGR